jgi:hypothetical protein
MLRLTPHGAIAVIPFSETWEQRRHSQVSRGRTAMPVGTHAPGAL